MVLNRKFTENWVCSSQWLSVRHFSGNGKEIFAGYLNINSVRWVFVPEGRGFDSVLSCRLCALIVDVQASWSLVELGLSYDCPISIIIIISIQPEGRLWREPEPSQATGMALAHCILGSSLGVGCHCFSPPLDVPTFASRCLHVQATWETSISERRNYGREMACQFCLWFRLPRKPRVLWHAAQICDMGDGFTSPPRKACCGFFSPEKSDGFGRDRTRDLGYQRPAC